MIKIYIIMPIGSDPKYKDKKQVLDSIAINYDVTFCFPDYCQKIPSFDLKSTIRDINSSCLVLADLSLERPSCYYELGLAQAIGGKIYLIAEEGTSIHQAYGRESIRFYRNLNELKAIVLDLIEKNKKANEAVSANVAKLRR